VKLQGLELSYLVNSIIYMSSTKVVQVMPIGVKIDPASRVTILHWIIYGKVQTTSFLEPLMGIWPNPTGMVPGWSPTKIVQMVLIGCSRSRGQNIGFHNAAFKNLLVWKYTAQSFYFWCITSSWGPLPIFSGQH